MSPSPQSSRARGAAAAPRSTGWIIGRVLLMAIGLSAVAFAVQGGEYGTTDLLRQRRQVADEQGVVESLSVRVAELEALLRRIETDPGTQERIAREEFGMIRAGEILYRFVDPVR